MSKIIKSDSCVEFLRILGFLFVVGTHTKLSPFYNGSGDASYTCTLISCFFADGVAVFWMILGFFFFKDISYPLRLKKLFFRIIIPMFVYTAIMFYLGDFLAGEKSFIESVSQPLSAYKEFIKIGLLQWTPAVKYTGYLWYLYVYVIVVLLQPAISGMKKALSSFRYGNISALIVMLAILVINDISLNKTFSFSHHTFGGAIAASFFVILGGILYENKEKINGRWYLGVIGIVVFVAINLLRSRIQLYCYTLNPVSDEPIYWFTSFAFIALIGLFLFVFGFSKVFTSNKAGVAIIGHLGKCGLVAYLVHAIVMVHVKRTGIPDKILEYWNYNITGIVLRQLFYMGIVFSISMAVASLYYLVKQPVINSFSKAQVTKK